MKKISYFKQKKALINVLERIYNFLEEDKRNYYQDYRVVGKETEQAKHWKTGELLWEV